MTFNGPVRWSIGAFARAVVQGRLAVVVEGREHVPSTGPAIVAARHYHHLYDAAVLLTVLERPVHFLVALDWVGGSSQRWFMEAACRSARWPVLLRPDALARARGGRRAGPYSAADAVPYLRRAVRESERLLQDGRLLAIFPEGYPNVDPTFTPKTGPESWLPFSRIVARIAQRAGGAIGCPVPIVPAGLVYEGGTPERVVVRFGRATSVATGAGGVALTRQIEAAVRALSEAAEPT